ncbi:MAG: hypothetical protein AAFP03_14635 [Cyanobacteria bacterium J06598_3]
MPRLSDRAFQIVKNEIERCYTDSPADQIERIILLARLQTLRARKGKPMNRAQIWEELSDIAPNFDQDVLIEAANVDTDSPIVGASIGIGAVAMLVSTAMGMETVMANAPETTPSQQPNLATAATPTDAQGDDAAAPNALPNAPKIDSNTTAKLTATKTTGQSAEPQASTVPFINAPVNAHVNAPNAPASISPAAADKTAFEIARSFGWKAALKGQNPPHSEQHWGEAADLWRQAIAQLERVSPQDPNYTAAQAKKTLYRQNLAQIESRQRAVQLANQKVSPEATPTAAPALAPALAPADKQPAVPAQLPVQSPQFTAQREDAPLKVAKRYGWQAAVAGQNAPHPPEKWADISRLWQTALLNLNKIEQGHPDYDEAQQVKARYQQNLAVVRQRYQQEQSATQRLRSLEATLAEIDRNFAPSAAKHTQLKAIVARLKTIPVGTQAHQQAQQLIASTNGEISAIAANPTSQVILSANE